MCSRQAIGGAREYGVSVSQPPRPPSWRDFIAGQASNRKRQDDVKFTDISPLIERASSDMGVGDLTSTQATTGSSNKQTKNKSNNRRHKKSAVHRTRSETHLNSTDLPENHELTISLAHTRPQTLFIREYGLRSEGEIKNAQAYLSHNARKCKEWLKSVEASEPLDDIAFTNGGSGIDLDKPEERWKDSEKDCNSANQTGQTSLTREHVHKHQGEREPPRVVVHHILVHEYSEGMDNTQSTSATLGESEETSPT